jgi:hypothetical protein
VATHHPMDRFINSHVNPLFWIYSSTLGPRALERFAPGHERDIRGLHEAVDGGYLTVTMSDALPVMPIVSVTVTVIV